jgi:predicted  nucleic acid-binding Zn-ribbon protein
MTGLTERLRALKTLDVHWERLATEAADEIERLRDALEEIEKRACPASCDNIAREALRDENP